MVAYGLTGGIGMGKSAVSAWLEERGEKVVDTDILARSLVEPGTQALREIEQTFGPGMLAGDGTLDRKRLATLVFGDPAKRQDLEAILHPRIRDAWETQVRQWRAAGEKRCFVVIPLLFETGAQGLLDRTICIGCTPETQLRRLRSRGWAMDEIQARLQSQWSTGLKMDRADYVIWNEGSLDLCRAQAERIVE